MTNDEFITLLTPFILKKESIDMNHYFRIEKICSSCKGKGKFIIQWFIKGNCAESIIGNNNGKIDGKPFIDKLHKCSNCKGDRKIYFYVRKFLLWIIMMEILNRYNINYHTTEK